MDTFIDRLSHKKSSQEMIQANSAADAAKMEQLQNQVNEYDALLQDMRKVNLKAAENMEQMQQMLEAALKKIEAVKEADDTKDTVDIKAEIEELSKELKKQMEEISMRSDDFQHRENVKVYRNVQASMEEALEKQTDTISQKISEGVRKQSALLPVSIIIMLMVIIDIAINLFNIVIKF